MRQRIWGAVLLSLTAGVALAEPPSYERDVKPFLTKYCVECHNDSKAKGGYRVHNYAELLKNGRKGPLVIPEQETRGRLIMSLEGRGRRMPPPKSAQPSAEEVNAIRAWVKAGAPNDGK